MKDICQIDANIQTLEQIFPENANSPQDTSSIMLHFNNISVLNNSIFHLLPKLVKLDLSANKLDNKAITILGTIPCALNHLNISSNYQITSLSTLFPSKASTLSNTLKYLDASFNFINDSGLNNLSNSSKLSELYLQGNSIVNLDPILKNLTHVKSLKSLYLQRDDRDRNPCCEVLGYRKLILNELDQLVELDEVGTMTLEKLNPLVSSILNTVSENIETENISNMDHDDSELLSQKSYYTALENLTENRTPTVTRPISPGKSRIPTSNGRIPQKSIQRPNLPMKQTVQSGSVPTEKLDHAYKLSKQLENQKFKTFKIQEKLLQNEHSISLKSSEIQNLKTENETLSDQNKKLKTALLTSKKLLDANLAEKEYLSKKFNSNQSKLCEVSEKTKEISELTAVLEKELQEEKNKNLTLSDKYNKIVSRQDDESNNSKNLLEELEHLKRKEKYLISEHEMEIKKIKNEILDVENEDFKMACSKVLKVAEERMRGRLVNLNNENVRLKSSCRDLEDELREALIGENERYGKIEEKFNEEKLKNQDLSQKLNTLQTKHDIQSEKFKDHTILLKEAKTKLETIQKSNQEKDEIWKNRIDNLERELTVQRKLANQIEPLKTEKARLLSRITAHESIMDGLKMERKKWTEELTTKGFELSNERGRLEAKISSQKEEIERLQKLNSENTDVIRVKSVLIDDQTKTVRELKEKITNFQNKDFEVQNSEKLSNEIRKLNTRKEELKYENKLLTDQVSNFQHRWKEKEMILEQLEDSIKKMKKRDGEKLETLQNDKKLLSEKFQKSEILCQKLEERFRQQIFLKEASYKKSVEVIKDNHEREIDFKNEQILKVENEMREMLILQEKEKKEADEKYKKVGAAFNLLKQGLSSGPLL